MQARRWQHRRETMTEESVGTAAETGPLPSKVYLAEGSEHIFRTHACPKCRRCFKMRSHLQEHLHTHFPEPSLQCPTCKRYFTSKSKLRVHRLREAGEMIHRCHLCEYSAVEQNAVRRHLVNVHEEKGKLDGNGYQCPTCGKSFHLTRSLKAHMKMHNGPQVGEPLACFQHGCTFQTSVRQEFVQHSMDVHDATPCECRHHACRALFPNQAEMETHYRTHQPYHCAQCDFTASNKTTFRRHLRHGHAGNEQLRCEFCSYVTFNPVEMGQHAEHLHATEKIHRCSQCSYTTPHKRGLKRHMLMHSGEKPHKCTMCDFRCRDESYLSKHMLTHSDNKNFMCAECGYVTKWKHYLNVHMRKHAGDLRYQCDQCPYRTHRMDQLNSHKLRHEAKTLICEICAYACKRKYELRTHMLAKHSGGEKQGAVYNCKYCTYTTCYRQALQNHENCKHTKLKEYRCALCSYSSFSSISLFLHKRKVHGYIPGDKAWLENYASVERERNSAECLDFFKSSLAHKELEQRSSEEPVKNQRQQSSEHCAGIESVADSPTVHNGNVFGVPQEIVSESVPGGPPTIENDPEEYCTLVLTTLSTTDYQTPALENKDDSSLHKTLNSSSLNCHVSQQMALFSPSSIEEENSATVDDDLQQCDLDEALSFKDQTEAASKSETRASTVKEDVGMPGSSSLPERNQLLQSNECLEAIKKHEKEQAESMVLEGRVQMVVVPRKKNFYFCGEYSYATNRKADVEHHCQTACHRTIEQHGYQASGAQSKQKQGLDGHRTKTCRGLPRKTGTVISVSLPCSVTEVNSTVSQEEVENQARSQELQVTAGPVSSDVELHRPGESVSMSLQENCKDLVHDTTSNAELQLYYTLQEDGKFACELCDFTSVRVATVERHLSKCKKRQCDGIGVSKSRQESIGPQQPAKTQEVSGKDHLLSCSNRHFRCYQKKDIASHQRDKPDLGLCCPHCPFTCKRERRIMARHMALKHKDTRPSGFFTTKRPIQTDASRRGCTLCGKTLASAAKLRQHKLRVHLRRPSHFCPLCDFAGFAANDIRRHRRRCHTEKGEGGLGHTCTFCTADFSTTAALRNHCRRAHLSQMERKQQQAKGSKDAAKSSATQNQCHLCGVATQTRRLLAQHLLSVHEEGPPEDKPLKCNRCEFSCRHQLVLEQHLRSHGGNRLYKCTGCSFSTQNKQKMTWHLRIHTGEKPYSCEQCSYSCTDPLRLKLHMRVHQEEKKYLCPKCGYKCKWATQLKYHMTKHTGDKPYACDQCDFRTNRADALRCHRDTRHCDARPYVCEKCGKAFKTAFVLKTHQHQHSSGRPYTCGLCQRAFRWPAGLRNHYMTHTKQQPFGCRHCPYRAKQKFQVVKHLQRHHPGSPVEEGITRDLETSALTLKDALLGTLDKRAAGAEDEEVAETVANRGQKKGSAPDAKIF